MSKKHLTLSDLKAQGLRLTKTEATELLPHITEISHRGLDDNYLFVEPEDIDDLNDEDPEDEDIEKRYECRKERLIAIGAVYSPDDKGFVCNHCFIDDQDVLNGDDEDFEENLDLAKIAIASAVNDNSDSLAEEQEVNLMATIGITTDNSPEEYLNALYSFIGEIPDEVPPKLLKKLAQLQELVSPPSETNSTNAENTETADSKKEHYATKRKRLKDAGLMEYTITQEDVDSSKYAGKVGDVIEIPIAIE
jgi:hypothetical protein